MSKSLKIKFNSRAKRLNLPLSFLDLQQKTSDFLENCSQNFSFLDEKTKKIIRNPADFDAFLRENAEQQMLKLVILDDFLQPQNEILASQSSIEVAKDMTYSYDNLVNNFKGVEEGRKVEDSLDLTAKLQSLLNFAPDLPSNISSNNQPEEDPLKSQIKSLVKNKMTKIKGKLVSDIYKTISSSNNGDEEVV